MPVWLFQGVLLAVLVAINKLSKSCGPAASRHDASASLNAAHTVVPYKYSSTQWDPMLQASATYKGLRDVQPLVVLLTLHTTPFG